MRLIRLPVPGGPSAVNGDDGLSKSASASRWWKLCLPLVCAVATFAIGGGDNRLGSGVRGGKPDLGGRALLGVMTSTLRTERARFGVSTPKEASGLGGV
eukprot:scaffold1085_cov252-Pinguiococcus_pyrenoidosus.AAC.20